MISDYQKAIERLNELSKTTDDLKLTKWCDSIGNLLLAIEEKKVEFSELNEEITRLELLLSNETKANQLRTLYSDITRKMQKNYGYVTPRYYTSQWMVLGMTVFGVPFGLMFGMALDNMAFFGIGLPIGMPIGMAIGAGKDKQAEAEGKVLNINRS